MTMYGRSQRIRLQPGSGTPHHFDVDTNDDAPRPTEDGTFYAHLKTATGSHLPVAGVTANWTLWKNGASYSGGDAILSAVTSLTDSTGTATITVTWGSSAGVDDNYQVGATP